MEYLKTTVLSALILTFILFPCVVSAETIDVQVSASEDDGYKRGSELVQPNGQVRVGETGYGPGDGWFRFTGFFIPQNATILIVIVTTIIVVSVYLFIRV